METSDKVKALIDDAKRAHVEIRGPDLRSSNWHFQPEHGAIRYGLGAIKGTGERALAHLLEARDELAGRGAPLELHALCRASDPNEVQRSSYEALIRAGAFDFTGHDRGAVLAALDVAMAESARAAADRKSGQRAMFDAPAANERASASSVSGDGIDASKAWSRSETLRAEREVLGFYLSGHPLEERAGLFNVLSSARTTDLATRAGGGEVTIAGLIVGLSQSVVKSGTFAGKKMARFRLEDLEGGVNVTVFPRSFEQFKERLVDDSIVIVKAKLEERAEERSLILEDVYSIQDALRRFEGGLVVNLEPQDEGALPQLKSTLQRHPGKRPVYFQVRGLDERTRRVRVASNLRVDINAELAEAIDRLLGKGRVRLARL